MVSTILSDREGAARMLPKSHRLLLNHQGPMAYRGYLEWAKNLHLRGLVQGVPSMGPPSCRRALGLTPH